MVKVKFKRLHKDALIPKKKYEDDFCYDCVAVSREEIAPDVYRYGLGFGIQAEKPELLKTNAGFDIRPRSSVWETGLVLSNCIGTVDESYIGEVSAIFYHVIKSLKPYEVGDRVCQLRFDTSFDIDFVEVEELDETPRGKNGYGSTGRK